MLYTYRMFSIIHRYNTVHYITVHRETRIILTTRRYINSHTHTPYTHPDMQLMDDASQINRRHTVNSRHVVVMCVFVTIAFFKLTSIEHTHTHFAWREFEFVKYVHGYANGHPSHTRTQIDGIQLMLLRRICRCRRADKVDDSIDGRGDCCRAERRFAKTTQSQASRHIYCDTLGRNIMMSRLEMGLNVWRLTPIHILHMIF